MRDSDFGPKRHITTLLSVSSQNAQSFVPAHVKRAIQLVGSPDFWHIVPTVSTALSSRRVVTANIWSYSSLLLVGRVGFGLDDVRLKKCRVQAMKSNVQFESWQIALPRRVATLARMHPLHRFEASKAARHIDLDKHDLRTLALMVFDAVIERMGLASGAPRDDIIGALKPIIIAAEPNADFVRVAEVATAVLDFLMNEEERRRAFREEMLVVEDGVQVSREVSFHYLQQVLGPNDEPLYRATVEGINLYTGTLGLDVEDDRAKKVCQ